jgi:hypothetical protein
VATDVAHIQRVIIHHDTISDCMNDEFDANDDDDGDDDMTGMGSSIVIIIHID